jgi:hypothetical protein
MTSARRKVQAAFNPRWPDLERTVAGFQLSESVALRYRPVIATTIKDCKNGSKPGLTLWLVLERRVAGFEVTAESSIRQTD